MNRERRGRGGGRGASRPSGSTRGVLNDPGSCSCMGCHLASWGIVWAHGVSVPMGAAYAHGIGASRGDFPGEAVPSGSLAAAGGGAGAGGASV